MTKLINTFYCPNFVLASFDILSKTPYFRVLTLNIKIILSCHSKYFILSKLCTSEFWHILSKLRTRVLTLNINIILSCHSKYFIYEIARCNFWCEKYMDSKTSRQCSKPRGAAERFLSIVKRFLSMFQPQWAIQGGVIPVWRKIRSSDSFFYSNFFESSKITNILTF